MKRLFLLPLSSSIPTNWSQNKNLIIAHVAWWWVFKIICSLTRLYTTHAPHQTVSKQKIRKYLVAFISCFPITQFRVQMWLWKEEAGGKLSSKMATRLYWLCLTFWIFQCFLLQCIEFFRFLLLFFLIYSFTNFSVGKITIFYLYTFTIFLILKILADFLECEWNASATSFELLMHSSKK